MPASACLPGPRDRLRTAALTGRRLALLGFGAENQAVARWLQRHRLPFTVCDQRPPAADVEPFTGDGLLQEWRSGPDYLAGLDTFEVVFRTPGLSAWRPELIRAQAAGTRITSQTRLFMELCPAPVLGITGTKGKGTTTSMVAEALQGGPFAKLLVAGNIGTPPLDALPDLSPADLVVLELSSFQLMDWDRSPHLALVLSVTQDHLDYHADVDEYRRAKQSISRYQGAGDVLMVNHDCPQSRAFAAGSRARVLEFSTTGAVARGVWVEQGAFRARLDDGPGVDLGPVAGLRLRGRHNHINAAAAALAALVAGGPAAQVVAGLHRFTGLPHRLEWVTDRDGVVYVNDSLATTPDAAVAALETFEEPVLWIAGGSFKGADFTELAAVVARRAVRAAILLGQEAGRLAVALRQHPGFGGEVISDCPSLAAAVAAARHRARPGDVVLLSPACASFGMFASYRERGEEFRRLAHQG
jgi:UDP-N-acetylmuramoylalanine--D-glutamate ligase